MVENKAFEKDVAIFILGNSRDYRDPDDLTPEGAVAVHSVKLAANLSKKGIFGGDIKEYSAYIGQENILSDSFLFRKSVLEQEAGMSVESARQRFIKGEIKKEF
jgi:hypothetical protein